MKLVHVDWKRFLALLPQWDALSPDLRVTWLELQPAALYTVAPGGEVEALLDGGWLTPAGGEHYGVARRRRYFHRVLRACSRVPVFEKYGRGDRQLLVDYLTEHYAPSDCAKLRRSAAGTGRAELAAEMGREEWLRHFLLWEGPGAGAEGPAARWRSAVPEAVSSARTLIATVIEHDAPTSIAELLEEADRTSHRNKLALGLAFVCREALLLAALDAGARPYVGAWRAPRATPVAAAPERAPQFDNATALFCRPLLVDDMATLLVESTAAPPRLKADEFALFARARDAIGAALTPLPGWINSTEGPLARDMRVDMAAYSARWLGFAAPTGQRGKDLSLEVTERGRRWLTLGARARLKQVLDVLRDDADDGFLRSPDEESPYGSLLPGAADGWGEDVGTSNRGLSYLPYDPGLEYPWVHQIDCRAAVTDAVRSIAGAAAVSLADFMGRQRREANPLTAIAYMPYVDEEAIDRQWESALLTFFYRRLVVLGAVALGPLTGGHLGFRLTPVGRYLLAETDQLEFDAPEETGDVLVQPNFEIVFLAPSVDAQLRARSYAEPTAALHGPESVGTLFVLRRESVQRAVMAGQDADRIVASLRELSKHPLPDNVERQVTTWTAEVRWIGVRPAVVVDCGDAETAARVLTVVGKGGRQLSATAVELLDGNKLTPALRKKLMAGGIFVRS